MTAAREMEAVRLAVALAALGRNLALMLAWTGGGVMTVGLALWAIAKRAAPGRAQR